MKRAKKQTTLEKFKKSYVLKIANEMAQDYEFIKNFTLNIMAEYMNLLSIFLKLNKTKLNNFLAEIKTDKKITKNNLFLKNLNFLIAIPKLIKIHNNEAEIDYVFLKSNFLKINEEEKINKIRYNLKILEQEFNKLKDVPLLSSFNLLNLYQFAQFILNFLTNDAVRQAVTYDLLMIEIEANTEENYKTLIDQQFIQEQKNMDTWNSSNAMQILNN